MIGHYPAPKGLFVITHVTRSLHVFILQAIKTGGDECLGMRLAVAIVSGVQ